MGDVKGPRLAQQRRLAFTPRSHFSVDKSPRVARLYWRDGGFARRIFFLSTTREADLSAQRTPPKAQARISRSDVDPRRPGDPQAAPRSRPQAPLCV